MGTVNEVERLQRLLQLEVSVRAMRHWQRTYFRTREKADFIEARRAEARVDEQLRDLDVRKIGLGAQP